jgi:hypothetical protein
MKTMITLGDMADKGMRMLEVACRKCPRRGRLSIARLIAEHGRDDYGDLRQIIAHDGPRMREPQASIYELCGVMFPSCRAGSSAPTKGNRPPKMAGTRCYKTWSQVPKMAKCKFGRGSVTGVTGRVLGPRRGRTPRGAPTWSDQVGLGREMTG